MSPQREDLIEAIGHLACDLSRNLSDADIRHDWQQLAPLIGEKESLTDEELEYLRLHAS